MPSLNACQCLSAVLLLVLLPRICAANQGAASTATSTTTSSTDVHVCIDARGHVAYQGMPCADGQRTRGVRAYAPQAVDPALAARTRAIEQEMDRRNRSGAARTTRAAKSAKSAPDPCKAAKARRKAMLDRAGVKRSYELLGEIDREVWALCKGL